MQQSGLCSSLDRCLQQPGLHTPSPACCSAASVADDVGSCPASPNCPAHPQKDRNANKGDGLGFMCCCFKPRVSEPGIDRMYSMGDIKSADTPDDDAKVDAKTAAS